MKERDRSASGPSGGTGGFTLNTSHDFFEAHMRVNFGSSPRRLVAEEGTLSKKTWCRR